MIGDPLAPGYAGDTFEYCVAKIAINLGDGLAKFGDAGWELVEVLEVKREPKTATAPERMVEWGCIFKRKKGRIIV